MIELEEKYNNTDELEFIKKNSTKSHEVNLYLHSDDSTPILAKGSDTVIGYKYPLFVERNL